MNFQFNYDSARARKSRFFVQFSSGTKFIVLIASLLMMLAGIGLWLAVSSVLGSLLLAAATILALPLIWYRYDIARIRPSFQGGVEAANVLVEHTMPADVVGRLKATNSPHGLWLAVQGTWYQHIFLARFKIHPNVFSSLSKDANKQAVNDILNHAYAMSQESKLDQISPVSLMIALLQSYPNFDSMLAELKLDIEDLKEGIRWIHHEHSAIESLQKKDRVGGLARDWTAGFTPTLNTMATNISAFIERGGLAHISTATHQATIDEMVQDLIKPRGNVLLMGQVGSGKTMTVHGLAKRLIEDQTLPESIRFYKVYQVSASAIIASSPDPNKVESTLFSIINEAAKAKDIVLFFDNAINLFTSAQGAVDLRRAMLEIVKNSPTPFILEMTPTEWQQVSAENQEMAGLVNLLNVPEADESATMDVLEDHCLQLELKNKMVITYKALKECIMLSDRYVDGLVFPGKAINILESSVSHAEGSLVTEKSIQETIEAIYGVKVQVADSSEGKELLNLEEKIHKRLINQVRAVKVVSDALRRARSGVGNPNKPIGTFLFLGPTGVGKTELSKALSETYFGDEDKIVRVDMNEFTQSSDLSRLIDTSSSSGLLSAVGRNRFTVVLFDEIEKAHPDVVNAFLQMLDEGEMRDVNNKVVSFRDTIVIGTSNAGADKIRAYIDQGKEVEQFEQQFINELIDGGHFRPEFLNRFDETVVFRPLKPEELLQITDLLLGSVNIALAQQKVSVALSPEAKNWLVEKGNDPRLGARPLKRMVQRTVENIVAKKMLSGNVPPGSLITLGVPDLEAEHTN